MGYALERGKVGLERMVGSRHRFFSIHSFGVDNFFVTVYKVGIGAMHLNVICG